MYKIVLTKTARKAYLKLPTITRQAIQKKLYALAESPLAPQHDVKCLQGMDKTYRLRVQNWRVVYRVEHKQMIIDVIKIAHRREVYQ